MYNCETHSVEAIQENTITSHPEFISEVTILAIIRGDLLYKFLQTGIEKKAGL